MDPSLLPWGLHETIVTKNPQVLNKDHFLQTNCFGPFWAHMYEKTDKASASFQKLWVWCRQHLRFEKDDARVVQMLMQLGCEFVVSSETLKPGPTSLCVTPNTIPRMTSWKGASCGNGSDCGHGRDEGNGGCVNAFCMYWKSHIDNMGRSACHEVDRVAPVDSDSVAITNDDSNKLCLCLPGTTIPCTLGRSHLNRKDLKDNFTAHFESIRYEVVTVGKITRSINRFGCCPLCKKELVVATNLPSSRHRVTSRK